VRERVDELVVLVPLEDRQVRRPARARADDNRRIPCAPPAADRAHQLSNTRGPLAIRIGARECGGCAGHVELPDLGDDVGELRPREKRNVFDPGQYGARESIKRDGTSGIETLEERGRRIEIQGRGVGGGEGGVRLETETCGKDGGEVVEELLLRVI
jgi:hypothetical protein